MNFESVVDKHLREKYETCLFPFCRSTSSIRAHSIQKARYLKPIANENGEIYMVARNPMIKVSSQPHRLKKVKLGEASTFRGLCSKHDDSLFKKIEKEKPDLSDFNHVFLFAYRNILSETYNRKRNSISTKNILEEALEKRLITEEQVEFHKDTIGGIFGADYFFKYTYNYFNIMRVMPRIVKKIFFLYYHINISQKTSPLACQSVFEIKRDNPYDTKFISMNVLPCNGGIDVIFLFKRKHKALVDSFLEDWFGPSFSHELSTVKLSTLILCRSEVFCISPNHFEKFPSNKQKKILDMFSNNMDMFNLNIEEEIDLFNIS